MRALVPLAAALFLATLLPSAAQQISPRKQERTTGARARDALNKPALSQSEKEATAAKARNEARERSWDERMKRTMRSICSGATGC